MLIPNDTRPARTTAPAKPHRAVLADRELPPPRGPLSSWVLHHLARGHRSDGTPTPPPSPEVIAAADPLGDDLQLALYLAYEVHYSDPRFDPDLEWDPTLLGVRAGLEGQLERALADHLGPTIDDGRALSAQLADLIAADDGPSLSRSAAGRSLDELRTLVVQRSLYHRKEADPHTFAVPRLPERTKQHFVDIQAGEYGADGPGRCTHAQLYSRAMSALGLDPGPNAHLVEVDAAGLLLSNLISLFGLHRRWRGAAVGHLAAFECTSVEPMGRYVEAFQAAGAPEAVVRFYRVHVLADAHHEQVAVDLVDALAHEAPELRRQALVGARAALWCEHRFATAVLARWDRQASADLHAAA